MKNDWTIEIEKLRQQVADQRSTINAQADNITQKQTMIDGLIRDNGILCGENINLKMKLGQVTAAYRAAVRIANENRKMGSVILN